MDTFIAIQSIQMLNCSKSMPVTLMSSHAGILSLPCKASRCSLAAGACLRHFRNERLLHQGSAQRCWHNQFHESHHAPLRAGSDVAVVCCHRCWRNAIALHSLHLNAHHSMRTLRSPAVHMMSQPACKLATRPPCISQSLRIGLNAGNNLIYIYERLHDSLNPGNPLGDSASLQDRRS